MAPRRSDSYARAKRRVFLERLAEVLGVSQDEVLKLLGTQSKSSLRIHGLKERSREEIVDELSRLGVEMEPIPWCPGAYQLESSKKTVAESELFRGGYVYIQNASSLIPALALEPQTGDAVLDVCAAPGGKAAHIASLVANRCELWVNDSIKPRAEKMRQVLDTLGVRYAQLTEHPGQYLDKFIHRTFDRILLDAQCSAEGRIDLTRSRPLRFWSLGRIAKFGRLQKKMLVSAWKLLKVGGTLVYSTCTLAPEENEAPVDHLLRRFKEAAVEPIPLGVPGASPGLVKWQGQRYDEQLAQALRIRPSEFLEAFFVCKIVKTPSVEDNGVI